MVHVLLISDQQVTMATWVTGLPPSSALVNTEFPGGGGEGGGGRGGRKGAKQKPAVGKYRYFLELLYTFGLAGWGAKIG